VARIGTNTSSFFGKVEVISVTGGAQVKDVTCINNDDTQAELGHEEQVSSRDGVSDKCFGLN
jgi:hypothetical protein